MQKPPIHSGTPDPGYERIKRALEAILASEKFVPAPQMSAFLRYVVLQAISGHKNRIKAYTVAVDALGKPDTFDPQNDPVVRVLAGRLRSTLKTYYEVNSDTDVIIQMKPGSYVPNFILKEKPAKPLSDETHDTSESHFSQSGNLPIDAPNLSVEIAHINTPQWSIGSMNSGPSTHLDITNFQPKTKSASATANDDQAGLPPRKLLLLPSMAATIALLGVVFLGIQINRQGRQEEPGLGAASSNPQNSAISNPQRSRPDKPSLFVSAMGVSNSLSSQLRTMISGIFSESEDIRVYRLLRSSQVHQYWPEDYLVSLNILPLPDETQVSIQLIEAQTGRISHTETLHLSENVSHALSSNELTAIMNSARALINEDGPLMRDYKSKLNH